MHDKDDMTFTRADLDRAVRAMIEQRDALWALESERVRELVKPITPFQYVTNRQFERIQKLTGARPERFADFGPAKKRIAVGGVEFWVFDKEVA